MTTARRTDRGSRRLAAGLLALCAVPVIAGMVRLTQLASGGPVTPESQRYFDSPVPVVVHILAITPFSILGALQLVPAFRRRHPVWHRRAGRIVAVTGLLTALSGLWMTLFYPPPENDSAALFVMRLFVSTAMTAAIVLGFAAIRERDVRRHSAWMIRGYALGMGAGTQLFTFLPWAILVGTEPTDAPRAVMMGAGWLVNVVVAEWVIRRRPAARVARSTHRGVVATAR